MKTGTSRGSVLKSVTVNISAQLVIYDISKTAIEHEFKMVKRRLADENVHVNDVPLAIIRSILHSLIINPKAIRRETIAEIMAEIESGNLLESIEEYFTLKYKDLDSFSDTYKIINPKLSNTHEMLLDLNYPKDWINEIGQRIMNQYDLFLRNISIKTK